MKVAILNDTHAGIRNSSDIFANNADKFYSEVFFPHCLENNIKRIVHLGDVFDNRKFINFKSLNTYRKHFLSKLREYGMHMDVIPGNHDVFFKNTNDLNSLKELLGHYMNEITIHMEPTVQNYDGFNMALLPWICAENQERSLEFIRTCKADWLGGHLELKGFDVIKGIPSHHGLDYKIFSRFEQVISGHFHTKSEKDNIRYLGSQMEFFWNDAHDNKCFHVLDTNNRELEAISNPHTLFYKLVYDDTKHDYMDYLQYNDMFDNHFVKVVVINKKDLYVFDKVIEAIQNRPIHDLKVAENFDEFLGENVEDDEISVEDTGDLLDNYVDAVDTDLDKERIKVQMRNLLIEAQTLEVA